MYEIWKDGKIRRWNHLQKFILSPNLKLHLINYHLCNECIVYQQFSKMGPAPNFGVFLDFAHPILTEVDFSALWQIPRNFIWFRKSRIWYMHTLVERGICYFTYLFHFWIWVQDADSVIQWSFLVPKFVKILYLMIFKIDM